jgi:membrane protease YdiL (CAAX protease family)
VVLTLALTLSTSAILLSWIRLARPDLRDVLAQLPHLVNTQLVMAGFAFVTVNALMEELIWRGVIQSSVESAFGPGLIAISLQAASFGLAHIHGIPRGIAGILLAGSWGIVAGYLRQRTNGLLLPVLTHIAADATVFCLIVFVAR